MDAGPDPRASEPDRAPRDPRDLRASDGDRDRVAEALRDAAGEGRLSLDELEERLAETYAARTYRDLEPVLRDLPPGDPGRAALPGPPALAGGLPAPAYGGEVSPRVRPGAVATSSSAVAIFSGTSRNGVWVVPEQSFALAVFGGVDIDLRQAQLSAPVVTITATALFGAVDIIVPDDVAVQVDGVGIFGAFDGPKDPALPPGAPLLRVNGFAMFGGVTVKRKRPKRASW